MFSTDKSCNFGRTFQNYTLTAYVRYRPRRSPYSKGDNGDDDNDDDDDDNDDCDDDRIILLTNLLNKLGAVCEVKGKIIVE